MGLLAGAKQWFNGDREKDNWNSNQQKASNNNFTMNDPDLKGMALGNTDTIPVLEPVAKLTEAAVKLKEREAKDWKEQEQLHGREHSARTSIFKSYGNISQSQFKHGKERIKSGLNARDKGATQFGEYVFSSARPEFVSQNYRVQLAQADGENQINQLGQEFDQAINDLNSYKDAM